jgi:hypothetical protein
MKNQELVFYASRLKAVLLLLGSAAFVALGWWMTKHKPLIGWLCVAFFSLGVPAALLMFVPGVVHLRLDRDGFELKSLGRRQTTKWRDVQSFSVASIRGAKMIAIKYRPQYSEQRAARAVATALSGMEGAIPNSYNISLPKLERVLNAWLLRFGQESPNPSGERTASSLRSPASAHVERDISAHAHMKPDKIRQAVKQQ